MAAMSTHPKPAEASVPAKRDFRQEVTDRIITMLESGVAPWQKPWNAAESAIGMPINPTTDRAYRGGNAVHLIATGLRHGYDDPRWVTYKQAADHGWQVRRGEKGTQIEFWEIRPSRIAHSRPDISEGDSDGKRERPEARLIHRVYTVFNAKQIEGIPPYQPRQRTPFEVVQSAESILEHSGATLRHDQADRAYYNRSSDTIHLPSKAAFKEASGYYGTALHELAHWTGHPTRLNRATLNESYRFGDTNYAKEELRAELANVFLAAERGIPHDPEQHAAYVSSWIKMLREDKNEIFRAAHDASAATDFLIALERDRSIADQALSAGPILDSTTGGSSRAAVLEQETTVIDRDREDLDESSKGTARFEPTGDVRKNAAGLLDAAHVITAKTLGESARTVEAVVNAGTYRGVIIGEIEGYLIQHQSAGLAVLHQKSLLDRQPKTGETFSINYSNGKGVVREVRERAKANELAR